MAKREDTPDEIESYRLSRTCRACKRVVDDDETLYYDLKVGAPPEQPRCEACRRAPVYFELT